MAAKADTQKRLDDAMRAVSGPGKPKNTRLTTLLASKVSRKFPIPAPFKFHEDLASFIKENELSKSTGTITTWAMALAAHVLVTDKPVVPYVTIGDKKVVFGSGDHTDVEFSEKENSFTRGEFETAESLVDTNLQKAGIYVIELVAANQVASLDDRNISSYFQAAGVTIVPSTILKLLPYLSSIFEDLLTYPELAERAKGFDWLKYHLTYASGNALVSKFAAAVGASVTNESVFKIPSGVMTSLKILDENPWNKAESDKIPLTLKGLAHVYLEAVGQLPVAKWYQGEKGRSNLSVATIQAVRAYAVTSSKIMANTDTIQKADNIAAVNDALAASGVLPSIN